MCSKVQTFKNLHEMRNDATDNGNKMNANRWLGHLLILSIALNIWQYFQRSGLEDAFTKAKQQLVATNIDIEKELDETYTELN